MCCETGKVLRERSFLRTSIVYLEISLMVYEAVFPTVSLCDIKHLVGLVSISSKQKN